MGILRESLRSNAGQPRHVTNYHVPQTQSQRLFKFYDQTAMGGGGSSNYRSHADQERARFEREQRIRLRNERRRQERERQEWEREVKRRKGQGYHRVDDIVLKDHDD